jgi:hypothetical protein
LTRETLFFFGGNIGKLRAIIKIFPADSSFPARPDPGWKLNSSPYFIDMATTVQSFRRPPTQRSHHELMCTLLSRNSNGCKYEIPSSCNIGYFESSRCFVIPANVLSASESKLKARKVKLVARIKYFSHVIIPGLRSVVEVAKQPPESPTDDQAFVSTT